MNFGGYRNRVAWVDLSTGQTEYRPIDEDDARKYIGGRGLGAKYVFDNGPQVDPLGPHHPLDGVGLREVRLDRHPVAVANRVHYLVGFRVEATGVEAKDPRGLMQPGHHVDEHDVRVVASRELLGAVPGLELREMERNGRQSFCCGAGGGFSAASAGASTITSLTATSTVLTTISASLGAGEQAESERANANKASMAR